MPRILASFAAIQDTLDDSLAVTSGPLDLAAQEGLDDVFGNQLRGWQGDGYYVSIIASMFHVPPAQDELGYTNGFHRFLGENLIRPVVGDDVLINATDGQIVYGTVLFSAGLVFTICVLPSAIELGMSSFVAAAQAAGIGAVMGAAGGAGMSICAQLDEGKSWGELSFSEIGESAFTGAVGGAIAGFGFTYLAALIPYACVAMPALVAATSGKSVYDGAVNIWHGKYYTGTAQVVTGLTGLWAVGSGLVTRATRALGGKCFVAGTQVVTEMDLPALGVVVATTEAGPESRALSGLAVTLLVVGVAGVIPLERRRRRSEKEEDEERQERDRALNELFHGEDLLDDPDPEENDDWVVSMRDDRPMNAVCDEVFGVSDNNWSQDSVGWRAPRLDSVESPVAVSLRQPRVTRGGHVAARGSEAMLIRNARREGVSRRPLLCRASIVWLAACLMLGAFCFGGAAWFSSMPDRSAARAAVPTSAPVTYVTKNIEDIRKNEMVVAWDPVTGELGRHEVTNTFERTSDHLRVLEFAAESDSQTQTLETTDEHPFWSVEAGDFVAAGDLRLGDRFISPAGEFSTLVSTHRGEHPEGVPVYNFEVADVHNYYVRAHGLRGPPVRVHNACGRVPKGFQEHHIISDKNPLTKNHELLDLAEFNLQSRTNKMFLPKSGSFHPTRSIHWGKHRGSVSQNLSEQMDEIVAFGRAEGWTSKQFNQSLRQLISGERQLLRSGLRALNRNRRPWAE